MEVSCWGGSRRWDSESELYWRGRKPRLEIFESGGVGGKGGAGYSVALVIRGARRRSKKIWFAGGQSAAPSRKHLAGFLRSCAPAVPSPPHNFTSTHTIHFVSYVLISRTACPRDLHVCARVIAGAIYCWNARLLRPISSTSS